MKVALDTTPVYTGRAGVARYVRGLQRGFGRMQDLEMEIEAIAWEKENFGYRQPFRAMNTAYRELWWAPVLAPRRLSHMAADLLHSTCNWFIEAPTGLPHVVTLHDVALLRNPERFRTWHRWSGRRRLRRLAEADRVICVSEFSAREANELLGLDPAKLQVVHNGCDFHGDEAEPDEKKPEVALPQDFFLFIGSLEPGKNLSLLREAYARARREKVDLPPLVIVGARWEGVAAEGAPPEDWHYLGHLPDANVVWLYRRARALVFPSKYEGFGLPLVEAMALGCPVIASPVASLPEVGGDAVRWSAMNAAAYVDAMRSLDDEASRKALVDGGRKRVERFSWRRCAEETAEVYRSVA